MEENTPEQRIEAITAEKLAEIQGARRQEASPEPSNPPLTALGWITALGFAVAIISLIMTFNVDELIPFTVWSSLIGVGLTFGFISLTGYLVVRALIESRKSGE